MLQTSAPKLSPAQQRQYWEDGYYFPIRVFDEAETTDYREHFLDYLKQNGDRWKALLPRDRVLFHETHTFLRWAYRMVTHARVLDAVESILGPNLLVWASDWIPKIPGENAYVSWHQDATYWGLHPPSVVTAWMALTESTPENGCMRVVPGSHKNRLLPQRDTYAKENILSRGQEIAAEVDESKAVDLILRPGEMSLHHIAIVHGSNANRSEKPRIGLAVRYITPDVAQNGPERDLVLLARGRDEFGHFESVDPPQADEPWEQSKIHIEALRRKARNIMPKDYAGPLGR